MATFFRVLGAIGRTFISTGVILLLFVAYQLWGTSIHTRAAQNDLEREFEAAIEALGAAETAHPTSTTTSAPATSATTPAPTTTIDTVHTGEGLGAAYDLTPEQIAALPPPLGGDPVGRVEIPDIGSNWWFVEGVLLGYLRDGPGHFPGTSWPGQEGNAALAGHRTTWGAPFHRLDEVDPGDEVVVTTIQGQFSYRVLSAGELTETMPFEVSEADADEGHFIIDPSDTWILNQYGDDRLTLMACNPKYSSRQRIVVVAELIDQVAPTTPHAPEVLEQIEEGEDPAVVLGLAGNDPDGWPPTIIWTVAAASFCFLTWQIGRTWPRAKWPTYALATPPFLAILFFLFTQVDRLLPAAY